jgi:hypothetical protein
MINITAAEIMNIPEKVTGIEIIADLTARSPAVARMINGTTASVETHRAIKIVIRFIRPLIQAAYRPGN